MRLEFSIYEEQEVSAEKASLLFLNIILRTATFCGNTENATNYVYFRCKYVYSLCMNIVTTLIF